MGGQNPSSPVDSLYGHFPWYGRNHPFLVVLEEGIVWIVRVVEVEDGRDKNCAIEWGCYESGIEAGEVTKGHRSGKPLSPLCLG